jgi:tetratricopeptide (TPR) repeat protein
MRLNAALHYEKAIRKDSHHLDARFNLALLYIEYGLLGEARKQYEAILKYQPGNREALMFLRYLKEKEAGGR